MSLRKKFTALLASLVFVFSATGCGTGKDTAWSAKYESYESTAGIFIYYEMSAYYQALNQAAGENPDLDKTDIKALKATQLDGKDMLTWIQDEATENLRKYLAVQAEFDNRGLELSDEDKKAIDDAVKNSWENYSSYYEQNGIGKESFRKITELSYKSSALFESYYGEGGTDEVVKDDIKNYYFENYARVKFIEMNLTDSDGNSLDDDAKAERKELAEEYIDRANDGENFDDLIAEYSDYAEALATETEAAAETDSTGVETGDNSQNNSVTEINVEITAAEAANEAEPETTTIIDDSSDEDAQSTDTSEDEESEAVTTLDEDTSASDETSEETAENTEAAGTDVTGDEESEEESSESGEETADTEAYANEKIIKKGSEDDGYQPSETVNKAIFENDDFGTAYFVDDSDNNKYYVVVRYDIFEREDLFEGDSLLSILTEMKGDDYDEELLKIVTIDNITLNDKAYKIGRAHV